MGLPYGLSFHSPLPFPYSPANPSSAVSARRENIFSVALLWSAVRFSVGVM